ncbi:MAG: sensor histidine kinase [Sporolactobacillus sp.]|jgi:NarL family two-component system sensor histidine kinase LiaS|nr:sensor histidine kinase [Sporolactobacillus sp.]
MTAIKRQLLMGLSLALLFLGLFSAFYFTAFPIHRWSLLWSRQIWHLPFVFIVPAVAVSIGLIGGFFSGLYWRNAFGTVDDDLAAVAQGRDPTATGSAGTEELKAIHVRLLALKRQMARQTQLSRKIANEKAELEEKAVQKIISEERNRLARELHDSVSQQLFAASMLLSTVNERRPGANDTESRQLRLVEQTIHQSQLEMRALFLHLRPVQLHGKPLKEGMEQLLSELRQKVPMTIRWTIEPVVLEKGIEDQLFRILQESVSNTLRHAKAQSLDVLLIRREQLVILRVSDDGIGFRTGEAKPGSYGLQNMHERAAQIGGILKLVSVPGKGTSLEVKVPILEEDES